MRARQATAGHAVHVQLDDLVQLVTLWRRGFETRQACRVHPEHLAKEGQAGRRDGRTSYRFPSVAGRTDRPPHARREKPGPAAGLRLADIAAVQVRQVSRETQNLQLVESRRE